MRETFGAKNPRSWLMRFHTQTAGVSLTAQQPLNNIVRTAIEALAGVLGGTQSLHTNSYDEALALPTEEAVRIALRTQQIIAEETGVANTIDPLGGSYFVEALTDATEARIIEIMADLDAHGGMVRAIEDGYLQGLIADEAYRAHQEIEAGTRPVVGVNRFVTDEPAPELVTYELDADGRDRQLKRLAQVKADRDNAAVRARLACLSRAAEGTGNLMGPLIDCATAYCTVGEMVTALKAVWGEFQQPVVF